MESICGAACADCSWNSDCRGCAATCGWPFGGACVAAEYIKIGGPEQYRIFRQGLLEEVNRLLQANGLPPAEGLCE